MSLFNKLKSIFVIEEGGAASSSAKDMEEQVASSSAPSSPPTPSNITEPPKTYTDSTGGSKPEQKFVDLLLKAIEAANVEGFDYLEYKQSLQSLTKIEPDDAKRYKSAFAMASTMGLTKKKLEESIGHYLEVLKSEEEKFQQALQNQRSTQINQREIRTKQLEEFIEQSRKQIQDIEKQIASSERELAGIESEIEAALSKVASTKNSFYASYELVSGQVKGDLDKIKTFLS